MNSNPRTAYILQIHKNADQVNKFINQLIIEEQADVFVHIDKKSFEELKGKIVKGPNVTILKQSINCEWGDISQIDATILLLREVLATKNNYDFVCLRSGQDLLVKIGFKDFLFENKNRIFMTHRKMDEKDLGFMKIAWPKVTRKRYTTAHPLRIYRKILLGLYSKGINIHPNSKKWPKEYSFYKGSQWFTIPYEVSKYIVKFLDKNEWYYDFFKSSLVPDESFFHTLILNSPYRDNVENNNLMFFKWGETLSERNSPQDLKTEDIKLVEDSNQFFARKFDEKIDREIVDYFASNVKLESSNFANKQNNISVLI